MNPYTSIDFHTYKPPKRGRRLAVIFIDYFSLVIMTFFFFGALCRPVYDNLSLTTSIWERYNDAGEELMNIVKDTHLQDEADNRLVPLEESAEQYLSYLLKTSYLENGLTYEEIDETGQLAVEEINVENTLLAADYKNDSLAYYYLNFRVEAGLAKDGENDYRFLNEEILDLDGSNKDLVNSDFNLNGVFYLNEENSQLLYNAIILEDTASSSSALVNRLIDIYSTACSRGIGEVENNYQPYIDAYFTFQSEYSKYIVGYDVSLLLAYLLGFLFVDVMFPAIFRNGRTISYKAFSLALADSQPRAIPLYKHIIKDVLSFILQFSAIFFSPLFLGALDMMMVPFLGPLTMLQFIIFTLMLGILSIVYSMISKNRQTLSELATATYTVDLNQHEESGVFVLDGAQNE